MNKSQQCSFSEIKIGDRVRLNVTGEEWIVIGTGFDKLDERATLNICGIANEDDLPAVEAVWADDVTLIARATYETIA